MRSGFGTLDLLFGYLSRLRAWLAAIALVALAGMASVYGPGARADDGFTKWLSEFWVDAQAFGISRATFDAALRGVEPDMTLPDLAVPGREERSDKGQAEFTKPPQDYVNKIYLQRLAEKGRSLLATHGATLKAIEGEFGVSGSVLLAIWGRETAFGTERSPHYAIRVLATQAYTGRRKELFRNELLYALKMLEDKVVTPANMRSSWAGAMGLPQLMPSEFYLWAYDFDGDGRKDIWNSIPDALASAARQLQGKGWVRGQPWGYEVHLKGSADCSLEGPANARTIAEWEKLGITRAFGKAFTPEEEALEAYLMMPAGAHGPAFLALENFKVIRRYNMSDLYALFVGNLSDRIAGSGDFEAPWQGIAQIANKDIEEIQQRLSNRGFAVDKIDGRIGSNTRWQIGAFQKAQGVKPDCWPSGEVLKQLRSMASR
jgi:lytic murein transglycosylase